MADVIYRHRDADFARSDHVNGRLIALEGLEDLAQEVWRTKFAARFHLDGHDVVLGRHGLEFAAHQFVVDQRALCVGIHRVLQTHGNACILCRLDTGGVEDLRAKIG